MVQSSTVMALRACSLKYPRTTNDGKLSANTKQTTVSTSHLLSSTDADEEDAMTHWAIASF